MTALQVKGGKQDTGFRNTGSLLVGTNSPGAEKFFRRAEYGIGKYYDVGIKVM
ncbi:hypothetical protein V6C53_09955 [Desulfocurvibacter africanus]|uniref:hypothetical protein n=1 Tax=Desulfocurvibacter africanus TaxID=873 RepID=UPI002FD927E3